MKAATDTCAECWCLKSGVTCERCQARERQYSITAPPMKPREFLRVMKPTRADLRLVVFSLGMLIVADHVADMVMDWQDIKIGYVK